MAIASSIRGSFAVGARLGIAHDLDLLVGEGPHQAQLAEHLHVLFVVFGGFADPLLAVFGEIEMEAETQPLAQFEMLAAPRMRLLPSEDDLVHRAALGRAAADQPLDPVLCHEVHGPRGAALNRLPALDREPQRPRHQRQLLERIAAIRHLRRQGVIFAAMRERLLVERLEDDVDLLFEELAVGRLVEQRRAEGFDLPRVIAAPDPENDAPAGQNVRCRDNPRPAAAGATSGRC